MLFKKMGSQGGEVRRYVKSRNDSSEVEVPWDAALDVDTEGFPFPQTKVSKGTKR